MKDLVKDKRALVDKEEEKKIFKAIHDQHRDRMLMDKGREYLKQKKRERELKKEKRDTIIGYVALGLILIGLITVLSLYTEKSVQKCMSEGYSENFCRYAGE